MLHPENKLQVTDHRMKLLLVTAFAMLALAEGKAQNVPQTPRLVVSITIDQLRYDYLERFSPLFCEHGFKRLMLEGTTCRNGFHNFINPDIASATAAIHTGTSPSINGIIGKEWFDRQKERLVSCIDDRNYLGNYTKQSVSPEKLMVSTLADELKIATQDKALVYSIAAEAESAILAAGRNANSALWINEENGKWCSTTYYKDMPYWANQYNDTCSPDNTIEKYEWRPLLDPKTYVYLTTEWEEKDFRYDFKDFRALKFKKFIKSAMVNEEIANMAQQCFDNSKIGEDDIPDLLAITLYAGNFDDKSTIECALEIQDTYARLDRQLARIIDMAAKKSGGHDRLMVVVTATGYVGKENADLKKYRIPSGEFYINRCTALLNMYLMAKHGQGNYVAGYSNNQIYLNNELIKERKLNYDSLAIDATEFLSTFDGIANAYTAKRIQIGAWDPALQQWRNIFNYRRSGDILYDLQPGWSSRDENSYEYRIDRANFIASPIFFWGSNIKSELIETPVNNNVVAPTVAYYLRIRAPNAAEARPMTNIWHGQKNSY